MKNILVAMALGLVMSVPVHAAEPKPGRTAEPMSTETLSDTAATTTSRKPTRYCVMVEPQTGSRIWGKMCQTRDAWLKQGFDPIARK